MKRAILPLVAVLGLFAYAGYFALMGCATAKHGATSAKTAVIECGKQDLPSIVAAVARWGVESALAGKVDWPSIETQAKGMALGTGSCAYAELIRAFKSKPTVQTATLGGGPDDLVAAEAGLLRVSGGAEVRLP